ncbi:MAG: RDD family protein [Acidimicrobiales bacterium]
MTDYPPPPPPPPPPQPGGYSGQPAYSGSGGPSGPRAGFWIRFAAALLDGIIISAVTIPLRFVGSPFIGFGVGTVLGLLYYGYFEGGPAGQTVGKKVLDIRVARSADGGPLGWATALLRHVCSWLSAIPCGLGYFWMLWDKEKQTWHDKLSDTVVVPASAWPPPPGSFGKAPGS